MTIRPQVTPMIQVDQDRGNQSQLLYSYQEARRLLGDVPESTFALWIRNGLFTPIKIGPRRSFVAYEDLVRLAQGAALPKVG